MKFERPIIEDAGINSLARMRDCTERQLKRVSLEVEIEIETVDVGMNLVVTV